MNIIQFHAILFVCLFNFLFRWIRHRNCKRMQVIWYCYKHHNEIPKCLILFVFFAVIWTSDYYGCFSIISFGLKLMHAHFLFLIDFIRSLLGSLVHVCMRYVYIFRKRERDRERGTVIAHRKKEEEKKRMRTLMRNLFKDSLLI